MNDSYSHFYRSKPHSKMLTEPLVLQIYLSWSSVLFSNKALPDGYIIVLLS